MNTLRLVSLIVSILTSAVQAASAQSVARIWNEQLLAAIRINLPNPTAHARNLHHLAVAMYDSWAAYDPTAVGYLYNEKISPLPADVEASRHEAMSYAAYRVLRSRFVSGQGSATTLANLDNQLAALGYSSAVGQAAVTSASTPSELGKRIGQAILDWGASDGFAFTAYPQEYSTSVNPNMLTALAMSVMGNNLEFPSKPNMPLGVGIPLINNGFPADTNPNFWQPLALSTIVAQNGISSPGGIQAYVGVQGLATTPFSLRRTDPLKPWIDPGGPSRISTPGNPSLTDAAYKAGAMDVLRKSAQLNDPAITDISPGAIGNNALGADTGTGYPVNPVSGLPYSPNPVKLADYARVLAEFWADGPNSETPPGHWHVLANEVSDNPLTVKKIGGSGPTVNELEWDVKIYFALGGAVHDAACAAWSAKRYYSGVRPITMIRYMGTMGQSSDANAPSYHFQGLPLESGVVEVITAQSAAVGQRHQSIWNLVTNSYQPGSSHIGRVVVYSFPGEGRNNPPPQIPPVPATTQNTVRWMFASDWLPFQRKTFNTPAFPGYVSGHSCFSRAAAEVLTLMTGTSSFPGGLHHHLVAANSMQIDRGPSADIDLQWHTYYDVSDQAGQSRRWGGIHPVEDDYAGRILGSEVGKAAFALAEKYWTGTIMSQAMLPQISRLPDGNVRVTWVAQRGLKYKVQSTPDLVTWADATPYSQAYVNGALPGDSSGAWTDTTPGTGQKFYRIWCTPAP